MVTSPSSPGDVVEGQAEDAGHRLSVEQHQERGDAGEQFGLLAGEHAPEQVQALPLADRGRVRGVLVRDSYRGHELAVHRPAEEAVGQPPGGVAAGVPGVDVGLPAVCEVRVPGRAARLGT